MSKQAKKYNKAKWFRVGVSGPTTDGRVIQPKWLTEMAETYDPDKYGARINMEHFKSLYPDSAFRAYGDVLALKVETFQIDGQDRTALYAQIDPTDDLVLMIQARQKVYTSMEIKENFAASGKFYLSGLAVTDDPASLGTEMLSFSARGMHFTPAFETELNFEELADEAPGLLAKIKAMFSAKKNTDEARFADVHAAVEEVAAHQVEIESQFAALAQGAMSAEAINTRFAELAAQIKQHGEDFSALTAKLDAQPAGTQRPPASGGTGRTKTDC